MGHGAPDSCGNLQPAGESLEALYLKDMALSAYQLLFLTTPRSALGMRCPLPDCWCIQVPAELWTINLNTVVQKKKRPSSVFFQGRNIFIIQNTIYALIHK